MEFNTALRLFRRISAEAQDILPNVGGRTAEFTNLARIIGSGGKSMLIIIKHRHLEKNKGYMRILKPTQTLRLYLLDKVSPNNQGSTRRVHLPST